MQIAVEGLIGVGKSTFVEKFTKLTGFKPQYESVEDNPFLSLYYEDPKRWGYTLQSYFLYRRYNDHMVTGDIILDRSLYGDIPFADLLLKCGYMTGKEHSCYISHFNTLEPLIPTVDVCIFLKINPEKAMERVYKRERSFEIGIDIDYLKDLEYEISKIPLRLRPSTRVIEVEWGDMDEDQMEGRIKSLVSEIF